MHKKPLLLNLLTLALFCVALAIPLQIAVFYEHGLDQWHAIFQKMTILNWIVLGFCLINAFLSYQASKWIFLSFPSTVILVGYNNFLVGQYNPQLSPLSLWGATLGFALLNAFVLHPESLRVLKDSRLHWWKTHRRLIKQLPVILDFNPTGDFCTYDVSMGGIFVPIQDYEKLKLGEVLSLKLKIDKSEELNFEGEVVRKTPGHGRYPAGVGLRFKDLSQIQRKKLSTFLGEQFRLEESLPQLSR